METAEKFLNEFASKNGLDVNTLKHNFVIAYTEALKTLAKTHNTTVEAIVNAAATNNKKVVEQMAELLQFALDQVLR